MANIPFPQGVFEEQGRHEGKHQILQIGKPNPFPYNQTPVDVPFAQKQPIENAELISWTSHAWFSRRCRRTSPPR